MTLDAPLYMLRHGETAWNTERRMQGTKDSALTERGRAQALAMGRTLKAELAAHARPHDLPRAARSAACARPSEIIGRELGLDAAEWRDDPRLVELSYGQWEGFSWKDIEVTHPTALSDWRGRSARLLPTGRREPRRAAPALGRGAGRDHRLEAGARSWSAMA